MEGILIGRLKHMQGLFNEAGLLSWYISGVCQAQSALGSEA